MQNQHTRRGFTQTQQAVINQRCHSRGMLSGIFNACRCKIKAQSLISGYVDDPRTLRAAKPSGMTPNKITAGGFTLIELLVVVLIIGILAAVALPQYRKAVMKSRYATIKSLVDTLAKTEEIFYLSNHHYSLNFDELDIDTPVGIETKALSANAAQRTFDWGKCVLSAAETSAYVSCELQGKERELLLAHMLYLQHSTPAHKRRCVAGGTDLTSVLNQVCKGETGQSAPDSYPANVQTVWLY